MTESDAGMYAILDSLRTGITEFRDGMNKPRLQKDVDELNRFAGLVGNAIAILMKRHDERRGDAELIDKASRHEIFRSPTSETIDIFRQLADRLAALTTPEPWLSVDEPPELCEPVFVRVGGKSVVIGMYHAVHGWNTATPVTGWKPIVRPLP